MAWSIIFRVASAEPPDKPAMTNPVLCTFESRRSEEMRSLIERLGGSAVVAPSMQELPVEENRVALDAIREVVAGNVSHMILLTGVGTEAMLNVADTQQLRQPLLDAMATIPLLVRGPKPAAVLSKLGLKYTVKAPEPNTWRDLLTAMGRADININGQTVAVQEYGVANPELYAALRELGAAVLPIPVYCWALPDDIQPLQQAVTATIAGQLDALLFTSAQQLRHVLMVAEQMQQRDQWLHAAAKVVIASIGPTCSETIREEGLPVHVEASPPKMGPLVRSAVEFVRSATT